MSRRKRREQLKNLRQRNLVKSMEMQARVNIQNKQKGTYFHLTPTAKHNELKISEWFTIQNEISALAKRQAEMKRIKRMQRAMDRRIKHKTAIYDDRAGVFLSLIHI